MDFFNVKRFRRARKPKCEEEQDPERDHLRSSEESKDETVTDSGENASAAAAEDDEDEDEDDDDDDFITNEVKRRLKELRKNSFMVLIPEEETCPEEGEGEEEVEEESSSSEWRESQAEAGYNWCGFDTLYNKYCERMLFFDKMSAQQLKETGILSFLGSDFDIKILVILDA